MQRRTATHRTPWAWYLLLVVPFIAVLWVPFYAGGSPQLAGIPYFYWYQFLWVLISAVLTAIVYFATREPDAGAEAPDEVLNEELA
jgi:hypothetical protein